MPSWSLKIELIVYVEIVDTVCVLKLGYDVYVSSNIIEAG